MNKKIAKLFGIILIILFISMYIVTESGYYEYKLQEKTILTNNRIKEFEEDIKKNKDIDIKEYYVKDIDYSNKITNFVYKISNGGSKIIRRGVKKLFKKLSYLIED